MTGSKPNWQPLGSEEFTAYKRTLVAADRPFVLVSCSRMVVVARSYVVVLRSGMGFGHALFWAARGPGTCGSRSRFAVCCGDG